MNADRSIDYDADKWARAEYGEETFSLYVWQDAWQWDESYDSWDDARHAAQVWHKKGYSVKLINHEGRKVWEAIC